MKIIYAAVTMANGELYTIRDVNEDRVRNWLYDTLLMSCKAHTDLRMTPLVQATLTESEKT